MPTKKPRLNITLEPKMSSMLSGLAKRKRKSVAGLAIELMEDALERDEDIILSRLALIRDTNKEKIISHKDAWK